MGKHLVLVGGGHAHMVTLASLHQFIERGHTVTVIGPSSYHYYSGMGPGMLSEIYTPDDIRFATRHLVEKQGGTFVLDKVARIEPEKKLVFLESGEKLAYDVLSFNTGSYVPWTNTADKDSNTFSVKPIEKLIEAQGRLIELARTKKTRVGVIGGGAAAVEIAGNAWRLLKNRGGEGHKIQIFSGGNFLSRFPEKVCRKAIASITARGIDLFEESYVEEIKTGEIKLVSGDIYPLDFIFLAVGVKPSKVFKDSGLPIGPDEGLLVNTYLQSTQYPEIFGGGDCIYFQDQPLDKVGVYAVRQNPILFHNLMASLEETELIPFDPGGDYLLIFNMGDGTGIFYKKGILIGGRIAFTIKDYVDRKFMRKFQSYE